MTNISPDRCRDLGAWMKENVRKIVLITHANPDGDALGSSLGLNGVLNRAGYQSTVIFPTDFPPIISGLNDYSRWMVYLHQDQEAEKLIREADMRIYLDFNDIRRAGKVRIPLEKLKTPVVLIDHHPDPIIDAGYIFSDIRVSSTAELVYDFIVKMGWSEQIDPLSANALLTGIIADTASFSHNARRAELYRATASLVDHGADQARIQEALFNTNTEERLRLLGFALSEKMEIFPQFHAAIIVLSREELKRFNYKIGDTEGFVNYPLSISGIIFSAFFMENEDKIKISFRSKGPFAVNEFSASHFSGGGHFNAAGGESRQTLREAVQKLIELLPSYAGRLEEASNG